MFEEIEKEKEETVSDRTLALPGSDPDRPSLVSGFDFGREGQAMTGLCAVKDRTHGVRSVMSSREGVARPHDRTLLRLRDQTLREHCSQSPVISQ